jgi:ABC-type glycerol-3-phosphate transport system substrate-binding protein
MTNGTFTRRDFLVTTAVASAALAAPFVRTAHAAGKLSVGFWDHWVPGANDTLTKICQEWAEKEKVELQIDYITSQGNKNLLTIAAEEQAKSGHDILQMPTWQPADKAKSLEPMDDVMRDLIEKNGEVAEVVSYLGKQDGHWLAVPATTGSQMKPPCARVDLLKQHVGWDPREAYPAGASPNKELADKWTYDAFLLAAEKCHKAGVPFGLPLGQTTDAVDWVGAMFAAFGSELVDRKGDVTVKSDATKQVLDYAKRLVQFLPPDVFAWDDASNNKWLVSGRGALITNPPSAWAVAKRDAPQIAEQCWTFPMPAGPKGRYQPFLPYFLGTWNFSKNKSAAKSLLSYVSTRESAERLVAASQGYDLPSFAKLRDFKTWAEEGPPKGTIWHYPPREGQIPSIAASPAPPKIANQIYVQATMTKMIARVTQNNEAIDKTIAWAESEIEGFMRT